MGALTEVGRSRLRHASPHTIVKRPQAPALVGRMLLIAALTVPAFARSATAADAGAPAKRLVYGWQGRETFSIVTTDQFRPSFEACFRDHEVLIEDRPTSERLLEVLSKATVVYASVHAGYAEAGGKEQHLLWSGSKQAPQFLTAADLAALRQRVGDDKLPRLMVVSGCELMADGPPGIQRIPEALGFDAGPNGAVRTPGRALLGFRESVKGVGRDHYFREFFDRWSRKGPDGSYLTLLQAKEEALKWVALRNPGAVEEISRLVILGDSSLRYGDVFPGPGPAPTDTIERVIPPGFGLWSVRVLIRNAQGAREITDVVAARSEDELSAAIRAKREELQKKHPSDDINVYAGDVVQSPGQVTKGPAKDK